MRSGPAGRLGCDPTVALHAKHLPEVSIAEQRHGLPLRVSSQELPKRPPLPPGIIPVKRIPIVEIQDGAVQQQIGEKSQHSGGRAIEIAIDEGHCRRTELMRRFEIWGKSVVEITRNQYGPAPIHAVLRELLMNALQCRRILTSGKIALVLVDLLGLRETFKRVQPNEAH
jgi:hypothetical protein